MTKEFEVQVMMQLTEIFKELKFLNARVDSLQEQIIELREVMK